MDFGRILIIVIFGFILCTIIQKKSFYDDFLKNHSSLFYHNLLFSSCHCPFHQIYWSQVLSSNNYSIIDLYRILDYKVI